MSDSEFPVLIITGPTASGKTEVSFRVAEELGLSAIGPAKAGGEIINADIGQFYPPCSIGTAKIDWRTSPINHHLFDILDEPRIMNVREFRELVIEKVKEIRGRGRVPILVGGSLFYIQSLFFPVYVPSGNFATSTPQGGYDGPEASGEVYPERSRRDGLRPPDGEAVGEVELDEAISDKVIDLWTKLYEIDPDRAQSIHPHDTYRIKRALAIWKETGEKPSEFMPTFTPPFEAVFLYLNPGREELLKRIEKRTKEMVGTDPTKGIVGEVAGLIGTKWEPFLRKRLIGYPETFKWLDEGKGDLEALVELIVISTRRYAKRQHVFWKRLKRMLTEAGWGEKINEVRSGDEAMEVVQRIWD